ncbi:biotin/lipoyl-binding protein [Ruminiclostridium herbifermentans]|uniref:Biotin/lipoyl-binding protein n=1 Tax=Ruminiclostridium herbifermentans TaxID=2488810 RepID=A0A4U7JF34_9FIRM|nr:biotin/lipoyl-binding protein [Ruminiclostridium herbifermentans]QNU67382.1 biotin/lipoyl-binding protein [Ruminiclostridium herbifermentans]
MMIRVFISRRNFTYNRKKLYIRKNLNKVVVFSLIFSMIFLAGCSLVPKEEEVLAPILKEPPKVVYNTIEIKPSTFEKKFETTGIMISANQVELSFSNSSGRLKAINVNVGDHVKKGQILAELITEDLDTQIKEQELLLNQSKLELETIKLNNQKDNNILKKQIDSLKLKLEKMKTIPDAYSEEEINDLQNQIEEKEITYKDSVHIQENNIKVKENSINLCQLKIDTLRQNLEDSRIIAPIDGVVNYKTNILVGSNIDAFTTVVSLADPKALQVTSTVGAVSPFLLGMKVNVRIKDFETEGEVVMTPADAPEDASEFTKSTIRVKLDKLTPDIELGDFALITYYQMKKENAIVVDTNLIRIAGDRKFVNVLEDGVKKERDIEVGDQNQTQSLIVKGLSVGDLLIK